MNLEWMRSLGKVKLFQKGEFVCVEKEEGTTAYLLLTGNVDVKLGSFGDMPKTVATLEPGVIFGEMSLLENKPRNASVVAATDRVAVLEIEKSNFLRVLRGDKEIAYNLLRTLLSRMEKELDIMYRSNIAYVVEYRKERNYQQIQGLSCEQFAAILEQDANHAIQLLKFLSHSLAEINQKFVN